MSWDISTVLGSSVLWKGVAFNRLCNPNYIPLVATPCAETGEKQRSGSLPFAYPWPMKCSSISLVKIYVALVNL